MVSDPSAKERRAHKRYHVKEKVMLYNGTTFGEVVNISEGGIYCRFLMDTKTRLNPVHTIDLIDAPHKLFLQKISCIDLNWQDTEPRALFGTTALRECRLQFTPQSPDKNSELHDFIQHVITIPAKSGQFPFSTDDYKS